MVEILQNKNSATRFQILVEIAASGPSIQQKSIAANLGITPQAISDYIHQLVRDEMVIITDHSHYKISNKGVNWMLRILGEIRGYSSFVERTVTNITICAAIAESDINRGQPVGLKMKNGLLFATDKVHNGARGIAVSNVRQGEDIGISNIEGLVELTRGKVTILRVPIIQRGGSKQVNLELLKAQIAHKQQIGAIGIEALISLRRVKTEPKYIYGVAEAAVEAGQCGLPFIVVCTDDAISGLIKKLQEENLDYEFIDLRLSDSGA